MRARHFLRKPSQIARFTEGIPRNINNFCFNALSLACAMRQKTVDAADCAGSHVGP